MKTKSVPIQTISLQKRGTNENARIYVRITFENGAETDVIEELCEDEIYHTIYLGGLIEFAIRAGQFK